MNEIGKPGHFPGDCPLCGEALDYMGIGRYVTGYTVPHGDGHIDTFEITGNTHIYRCPECQRDWQNLPVTGAYELNLAISTPQEK